jgi:hypothetical protein
MQVKRRRPGVTVALVALGVSSILFFSACGDLSRDELTRGVESLSALAAQGQLVADGVARDATKTTYARVMAKTLGGEAEHEAEKLADAEPSPQVRKERNAAVQIATELADLFSELQTFPGDEHHAALVEAHMGEVEAQANALVERLGGEAR